MRKYDDPFCTAKDCKRERLKYRPFCSGHQARKARGTAVATPLRPYVTTHVPKPQDLEDYAGWDAWLRSRATKNGECLELRGGGNDGKGYTQIKVSGKALRAHRLMAAVKYSKPIHTLDTVHHSCHNRSCINPAHLFEVTKGENTIEMFERQAYRKRITDLEAALREVCPTHELLQ